VVSVIVPVFNGSHFLPRCLDAIERSSFRQFEVIVVDDASTDDSAAISRASGARVVSLPVQGGPGGARNRGALEAQGEILFFVDADVVIHPDAMARVAADLAEGPTLAAVFGSYDDSPAEASFISQYKNLYHHFTHQQASPNAATFWAGCGAIRRDVFLASGGFDQHRYHGRSGQQRGHPAQGGRRGGCALEAVLGCLHRVSGRGWAGGRSVRGFCCGRR
jgi:glycosyltransferase involved in cell wall biosynthesis